MGKSKKISKYTTIARAKGIEIPNKPVMLNCWVKNVSRPLMAKLDDGGFEFVGNAVLEDESGYTIETTSLSREKHDRLRHYMRSGSKIDVLGKINQIPLGKSYAGQYENFIELQHTRPGDTPLRILKANLQEKKIIEEFISSIQDIGNRKDAFILLRLIREEVLARFNIAGVDDDDVYSDCLDIMICQAYSCGFLQNTPGKLHVAVIGPSASGKKILWLIAALLNVKSEEAQATRTTPAGITAAMKKVKNDWALEIGKIPLADHGVFGMQDFDKNKKIDELLSIFGPVMEDGKCIISGVANQTIAARTAIYIDLNKRSDMTLDARYTGSVIEDTKLPIYILSRFDLIVELKKNISQQFTKGIELFKIKKTRRKKSYIAKFSKKKNIPVNRFLKLLSAYINSEYQSVDSTPVNKYMMEKYEQIYKLNKDHIELIPELAQFNMRFLNSIEKLTHSLTRLQFQKKCNKAAVDKALHLLQHKLEFIQNFSKWFTLPQYKTTGSKALAFWLCEQYGKKRFTIKKAYSLYSDKGKPCGSIKIRTFRTWVEKHIKSTGHNKWRVPDDLYEEFQNLHAIN